MLVWQGWCVCRELDRQKGCLGVGAALNFHGLRPSLRTRSHWDISVDTVNVVSFPGQQGVEEDRAPWAPG